MRGKGLQKSCIVLILSGILVILAGVGMAKQTLSDAVEYIKN
jgi:hypothetical protein